MKKNTIRGTPRLFPRSAFIQNGHVWHYLDIEDHYFACYADDNTPFAVRDNTHDDMKT